MFKQLPKNGYVTVATGMVLSYLVGLLPYDRIGADYGPTISWTLMSGLLGSLCAIAVSVVNRRAITIGAVFTLAIAVGLAQSFSINSDSTTEDIQGFLFLLLGPAFAVSMITIPLTLHRLTDANKQLEDEPA